MGVKISELSYYSSVSSSDQMLLNHYDSEDGFYHTGIITPYDLLSGVPNVTYDGSNYSISGNFANYLSQEGFVGVKYDDVSSYYYLTSGNNLPEYLSQEGYMNSTALESYLSQEGYVGIKRSQDGSYYDLTSNFANYMSDIGYVAIALNDSTSRYETSGTLGSYLEQEGYIAITSENGEYIISGYLSEYLSQIGFNGITYENGSYATSGYLSEYLSQQGYAYTFYDTYRNMYAADSQLEQYVQQEISNYITDHASEIAAAIQPYLS